MMAAACVGIWDPRTAHIANPKATPFQVALTREYAGLAADRIETRDDAEKEIFLSKAAAAASPRDVAPETFADAVAVGDGVSELRAALARLEALFAKGGRSRAPDGTAQSQALYDCWMREHARSRGGSEFLRCKNGFAAAVAKAEKKAAERRVMVVVLPKEDGRVGAVEVSSGGSKQLLNTAYAGAKVNTGEKAESLTVPKEEIEKTFASALAVRPKRPDRFRLFFVEASDELTEESTRTYGKVLAAVKGRPSPEVEVVGHTSSKGAAGYNIQLSQRRADAIRDQLIGDGIASEIITAIGRGENDPWIIVPKGEADTKNRRVEITVR